MGVNKQGLTEGDLRAAIALSQKLKEEYGQYMSKAEIHHAEGNIHIPKDADNERMRRMFAIEAVNNETGKKVLVYKTRAVADMFVKYYKTREVDPECFIAKYLPMSWKKHKELNERMKTCEYRSTVSLNTNDSGTLCCSFGIWNAEDGGLGLTVSLEELGLDVNRITCETCPFYKEGAARRGKPSLAISVVDWRRLPKV